MTESTLPERLRRLLAPPLIVFVLISIGFALGRQTAPRPVIQDTAPEASDDARVVLTYLHGDVRCTTCNTIEEMLKTVLRERYQAAMADERLVFREVNYDKDETLAAHFDITSSTAVISWESDGSEQGFTKLDGVWHYKDDPIGFANYIAEHIDRHLEAPDGTGERP